MSLLVAGDINTDILRSIHEYLQAEHDDPTIVIDSEGGDPDAAMAAACLICTHQTPVTTVNLNYVGSSAAAIFLAGSKRKMFKHALFMFHDGTIQIEGDYVEATKQLQEHFADHKRFCKFFEERTKQTENYWYAKTIGKDLILNASQSLKLGVTHEVI